MAKGIKKNEFVANGIVLQKTSKYMDSISLTSEEITNAIEGRYAGISLCQTDGSTVTHLYITDLDSLLTQVKRNGSGWTAFYTADLC